MILDTVEHYLGGATRCTFIEPYPDRLRSLLRPEDEHRCRVIVDRVQSVGLAPFLELSAGDILLIDGSHVSKVGSDTNWLIFEMLRACPRECSSTSTTSTSRSSIPRTG